MVKYAIAMGIRLVCFGLLFVVDGWWKIVPIIGAVFIPWFAVVIANGGSDTSVPEENALLEHAPQAELSAPPEAEEGPVTLQGEVVPDDAEPETETAPENTKNLLQQPMPRETSGEDTTENAKQ